MNLRKLSMTLAALLTGCAFGIASAKLPAPAPSPEQQAKAAEAKVKAAEAATKEAELLSKYQDRATDNFKRGKVVKTGAAAAAKK